MSLCTGRQDELFEHYRNTLRNLGKEFKPEATIRKFRITADDGKSYNKYLDLRTNRGNNMTSNFPPQTSHLRTGEHNHVEKPLLDQFIGGAVWGTPLLTEPQEARA